MPSEGVGGSGMKRRLLAAFAMLFCLPAVAVAANGADSGDTAWLLVATALVKAANEGETGDGKVFVFNLEEATRIRTGESGDDAI